MNSVDAANDATKICAAKPLDPVKGKTFVLNKTAGRTAVSKSFCAGLRRKSCLPPSFSKLHRRYSARNYLGKYW